MQKLLFATLFYVLLSTTAGVAQSVNFEDGFEDGDFTNNPVWSGDTGQYAVIDGTPNFLLQLQGDADNGGVSSLSTPSTGVEGSWEFFINLDFSPSNGNRTDVFLMSDIAELEGPVNGYALRGGEGGSDDVFRIVRYDNGSEAATILSGTTDISSGGEFRVRVSRQSGGVWTLEVAQGYSGALAQEGGTATDNTYTTTDFFGVRSTYTGSRADLFTYDFKIDLPPFTVTNAAADGNQVNVTFNQAYDQTTVQPADFSVDNGVGSPASVTFPSPQVVQLTYGSELASNEYILTAQDIQAENGAALEAGASATFIVFDDFAPGDVIINEFMYDPPGGQAEYVELKNLSGKFLNLQDWQIGDNSGIGTVSSETLALRPNDFIAVSSDTAALFDVYGSRPYAESGTIPALNNGGDVVQVFTDTGAQVDSLQYTPAWGGENVALERRSDTAPSVFMENFGDSPNPLGGTPGIANEVADDTTPPDLNDLIITDNQTLDLDFSERLDNGTATNTANYSLNNGIDIGNAQQTAGDSVRLSLDAPLQNGTEYQLTVSNQQDIFGNTAGSIDTTFSFFVVTAADSGDIFINEFSYDPPQGSTEYIELFNPTNESFDLNGWTINDNTGNRQVITDSRFVVPPDSFVVIAPDNTLLEDNPDIALVNMGNDFPSLNNSGDDIVLRDSTGTRLDSLQYTPAFGGDGVALERRTVDVAPIQPNFGDAPNGFGTPGEQNEIPQDTTPPDLDNLIVANNQTLDLAFSERLDDAAATNPGNFTLDNGISVSNAQLTAQDSVHLSLNAPLQNGTEYQLTIDNQQDVFGNTAGSIDTTISFFEVTEADSGDIFINEFTYDPPEGSTEYIELINPTDESFDLNGWTINDNTGNQRTITDSRFVVPPDSFVVIAPDNTLLDENPGINLVTMGNSFPSLNNSGDDIVLRRADGTRLDSLQYTPAFGGDNIAVERRTIDAPPVQANFGDAPNGFGTPGRQNEIETDTTPPDIAAFSIIGNQTLQFVFTEQVETSSATNTANYSVTNGISVNSAALLGGDTVRVALSDPLQDNTTYSARVDGVEDIFGNTLANRETTFTFFETAPADSGDIFINEFTYDPPEGSTEYIELVNASSNSLDLNGWTINDNTGNRRTITDGQFVVPPDSFVVIAPDNTLLDENPGINLVTMGNSFPSLNNSGDDIVLRDSIGTRLDSLRYTPAFGGNNIAVERRTTDAPPVEANFGDAPNGFGTPGNQNEIGQDTTPPELTDLTIPDNQTLTLAFSEGLDEDPATAIGNYSLDNGIGISNAELTNPNTVRLILDAPLQNNVDYQLTVNNQQDIFGNTAETINRTFTFVEASQADPGDIFINEFTYDPPEGFTEYVELFNPTTRSFDLNGWTINDNTGNRRTITNGQFIVPPDSYVVLAPDNTLQDSLPDINLVALGSDFPSLNNGGDDIVIRNTAGTRLDSLQYTPAFGGNDVAVERRTIDAPPIEANFGDAPNGFGSPGRQNEIGDDTTPPDLTSFTILGNQTLRFIFTEQVERQSAESTGNYALSGDISINSANLFSGGDTVQVALSDPLQNNTTYTVTIDGVEDLFGNTLAGRDTTFTFFETSPAGPGDIFINEFTYDPPEGSTEYIELFNTSSNSLDLQDWTINDNTGNLRTITNGQFIVPPNSFVVLVPDNTLLNDNPDIPLVALGSRFPSLNNSGDDIVLRRDDGTRLDSLRYTPAFGGNNIAVERRTTDAPPVEANFGDAPNGFGTPGNQNEIGQDTTPPELTNLTIVGNETLTLAFTEGLDEGPATATGNYSLDNGIGISNAELTNPNTVRLSLDSPLQNNVDYQLTVNNQQDIFGNTAEIINRTFTFVEASEADPGDIFINEFTYDPPEGSTEYVELFNPTTASFDLNGWTINDNTGNRRTITDQQFIVPPDSYVVLAPDNTLQDSLPDINLLSLGSSFPSLNNSGDDIVIRRADGTRLDSLQYTPAFGGNDVAVERRTIDAAPVAANFGDAPNGFGTPGRLNEIGEDTTPPDFIDLGIPDNQTLTLAFSEGLDAGTATDAANYSLSNGIGVADARQTEPNSVRLSLDNPLQNGVNYQLSIANQQDIFGNTAAATDTTFTFFEVSEAAPGEIFINEFTYDPPSGSTEYVELINTTSQSFDLSGWTISDNTGNRQVISNSRAIVPPNSFVVLAPDNTLLGDFPGINLVTLGSRFPSLNNGGDDIVIRNAAGNQLDSLRYTPAFGGNNIAVERRSTAVPPVAANFGDAPNGFGTPGSANEIAPDDQPPVLNTLQVIDNTTLQLLFSETITGPTATNEDNYTITPNRDIQLISSVQDTVRLLLSQPLDSEVPFEIAIQGLQDIFGNTIPQTTREFTFVEFSQAQPRDVVINEILYSRSSAANPEFVELFNRTDQNFDLSGWEIGDASSSEPFEPGTRLLAGGYLVATDNITLANTLDNAIFLADLPSLNDDGDAVVIRTDGGATIDSLVYNPAFGGTQDGTSAERIDPNAASNDASNFASSTASSGSTPGEQNSVFQRDEDAPEIVFSRIFPNGDIEVRFSEFISLTDDLSFTLGGQALTIDDFDPARANVIFLNTPSGTVPGSAQTVTAQNVSDVSGNVTASTQQSVAQPLSPGDVVINEILFDPLSDDEDNRPDQNEYIELRNIRDFAVSLEGITLHDAPNEDGEVRTLTPVSTNSRFIPAQGTALVYAEDQTPVFSESNVARFFDIQDPAANTIIQVDRSSLSLASTGDAIFLTGSGGAEIDSVFYNESWHNPNLVDTDGIALERINPFGPSNDDTNWGSSTAREGGTPNSENTLFQTVQDGGDDEVGISFSTNPFSPDGDGTDDNLLINYRLDESDFLISVRIYDRYGRLVSELADAEQAGFTGTLTWNGLKDDGSRNRIGIYIVIFEAFDSASGNDRTFKETVVLARRLN